MRERFEASILPKIRSQIAGLDKQEPKNDAILELRRELLVRHMRLPGLSVQTLRSQERIPRRSSMTE